MTKLTIELIPKSSHFKNVRSEVSKGEWDRIRKKVYKEADYRCEICNGKGPKWPVECHEIFEYNTEEKIQKLIRLIALCPSCHEVKHIGLAGIKGRYNIAKKHLCKVNGWSDSDSEHYIQHCFEEWSRLSKIDWKLDLTNLDNYKD